MQNRKIIFVAKCFNSSTSGPANIVRNLIKYSNINNINSEAILLTEEVSRFIFIKNVINKCIFEQGCIINTHTDGFFIPILVLIMSYFNKKNDYYLTVHGIYFLDNGSKGVKNKVYCFLEKILYKRFPCIICVSKMLADDLGHLFNRKESIIIIPNATDASSNRKPIRGEKLRIVSLGGLKYNKGIKECLNLFKKLRDENIPFKGFIYGAPDGNENWFKRQIITHELENNVEFKGLICNKQDVYDKIVEADLQLCLSHYDTYNVAIAESLVLGCPVISSDRCGASYLISGAAGIVVSLNNEEQNRYKESLKYIRKIQDKNYRESVYEKRVKFKEKVSWNSIIEKYAAL